MGKVVLKGEAMHHTEPLREQVCNMGEDKTAHVLTIQKMPRLKMCVCNSLSSDGLPNYNTILCQQNKIES